MRSASLCRDMSDQVYSTSFPDLLQHVLQGSVLIAHGELDQGDVVGWLSFSKHVLRYTFVKNAFRRNGIMSLLLDASGLSKRKSFCFSVRGPLASPLEKHFRSARYKPAFATSGLMPVQL